MELLRSSQPSLSLDGDSDGARAASIMLSGSKESIQLSKGSELRLSREDLVVLEHEEVQVECRIARKDWKDIPRRYARAYIIALDVGAMHLNKLRPDQCVQNKGASTKYVCSKPVRLENHNRWQFKSLQLNPLWFKDGESRIFLQLVLEDLEVGRDRWTYITGVPVTVLGGPVFNPKPRLLAATGVPEDPPEDDGVCHADDSDALVAQALAEDEQETALNATLVEEALAEIHATEEQAQQERIAKNFNVVAQALANHMESLAQAQLAQSVVAQALEEEGALSNDRPLDNPSSMLEATADCVADHADAVANAEIVNEYLAQHADAIRNLEQASTALAWHADSVENREEAADALADHPAAVTNPQTTAGALADHAEVPQARSSSELAAAIGKSKAVMEASEEELKAVVDALSPEGRRKLDATLNQVLIRNQAQAPPEASDMEIKAVANALSQEGHRKLDGVVSQVLIRKQAQALPEASEAELKAVVNAISPEGRRRLDASLSQVLIRNQAQALPEASEAELKAVVNSLSPEGHRKLDGIVSQVLIRSQAQALPEASEAELEAFVNAISPEGRRRLGAILSEVLIRNQAQALPEASEAELKAVVNSLSPEGHRKLDGIVSQVLIRNQAQALPEASEAELKTAVENWMA
eukprot:TRINITY_DN6906_c0_g1_i2.p1 TRINITY_DN6906_c0_g1~~TRINITY_DN6906_c0_g1_i2.p1  ORF type:complete len:657 (-),score=162.80 TRINITY_DN6906_c0_g1_i2:204-2138(-)